jgi:hypothetical protein
LGHAAEAAKLEEVAELGPVTINFLGHPPREQREQKATTTTTIRPTMRVEVKSWTVIS